MKKLMLLVLPLFLFCTNASGQLEVQDLLDALKWRNIGPVNMGGRIVDIAMDPSRHSTFYVAAASGGLFKTENNGVTFKALFQHENSISIGAVCVAPSDPKILLVGTGEANARNSVSWGDGVYRSADGGETWEHCGLKDTKHIGRIAIHPENPDIIYVAAVGHTWGPNEQRGLFKSCDGGKSWKKSLYMDDKTGCVDVAIDPECPNVVYAAAYERQRDRFDGGNPAKRTGPGSGLFRSRDHGETWERLKNGLPSHPLGRIGLGICEKDPKVVYAIVETDLTGERVRGQDDEGRAYMGISGREQESGYKITSVKKEGPGEKAGLRKNDIIIRIGERSISGLKDMMAALNAIKPGDEEEIAVLRDHREVVVKVTFDAKNRGASFARGSQGGQTANMQSRQGGKGIETGGLFKSTDRGDTWVRVNSLNPRPFYYSQVRVDPSNGDNVYVLGVSLYYSKDGGKKFNSRVGRGAHPDHHAMWIDPTNSEHVILGGDGGLYVTYDLCKTWDFVDMLPIGQFYNVAVDLKYPYNVYGGLQDNGCWCGPSASHKNHSSWVQINGGDGFRCAVDPTDQDVVYCESQNGAIVRKNLNTNGTQMVNRATRDNRFNWNTPFLLSPHNAHTLYFAGDKVFRSVDRGDNVKAISPEITLTDKGSATALAESPRLEGVLYVGADDGAIFMSKDGGQNWTQLKIQAPTRYVSDIEASGFKDGRVYVTLDGHREDDYKAHVFASQDFGKTWASINKGLPEAPVRCIVEDLVNPDLLFIGSEFGCYVSVNQGASWSLFKNNLPTVPVHDLVIHPREMDLVAGTHGRGIWIADIKPLQELNKDFTKKHAHLFQVKPAYLWVAGPSGDPYGARNFKAEQPPSGAMIYYALSEDHPEEEVTLEISDVLGKKVSGLKCSSKKGCHQVVWNFRSDNRRRRPPGRSRIESGDYMVSLTVKEKIYSQKIRVYPDPEVNAPLNTSARFK